MSSLWAIVKAVDRAVSAAERGLRSVLGGRRLKPCPILIPVEPRRRGR